MQGGVTGWAGVTVGWGGTTGADGLDMAGVTVGTSVAGSMSGSAVPGDARA